MALYIKRIGAPFPDRQKCWNLANSSGMATASVMAGYYQAFQPEITAAAIIAALYIAPYS